MGWILDERYIQVKGTHEAVEVSVESDGKTWKLEGEFRGTASARRTMSDHDNSDCRIWGLKVRALEEPRSEIPSSQRFTRQRTLSRWRRYAGQLLGFASR